METAVAHGYASVRVKGHAEQRARERRALRPAAQQPSQDWVAALTGLSGGPTPAPADSPVKGLTSESFREQVAAMRAAEYEAAKKRGPGRA